MNVNLSAWQGWISLVLGLINLGCFMSKPWQAAKKASEEQAEWMRAMELKVVDLQNELNKTKYDYKSSMESQTILNRTQLKCTRDLMIHAIDGNHIAPLQDRVHELDEILYGKGGQI